MKVHLLWLRALLTALGVVVLVPCAAVVIGGLLPALPMTRRFGPLIDEYLPWVGIAALISTGLLVLAVLTGGTRLNKGLAGVAVGLLLAIALVGGEILSFSGHQGVSIDLLRTMGFGGTSALAKRDLVPDATTTYATTGGQALGAEIWRPSGVGVPTQAGGGPGLVYVHGGGFTGGGLRSRPALFRLMAESGITVIDVEYRLAPPPRWDEAATDVICAVAWVVAHGAELDVDPSRIVLAGDSAGGNLALLAGYAEGSPGQPPYCGETPVIPAAVIAIAPAADLTAIWEDHSITTDGLPFPETYIGGTPDQYPDRYRAASPLRLIRGGLPPTLLITGSSDLLVYPEHTRELAGQIRQVGIACSLLVIPFAGHGFDGAPDGFGAQIEEAVLPAYIHAQTGGPSWEGPRC